MFYLSNFFLFCLKKSNNFLKFFLCLKKKINNKNKRMKKNKQLKDFQITSFIEGEDDDGHYKLEGDLEIAGIM